jgi:hypothetical protein
LAWNISKLGIDKLPRSLQVVSLKLPTKEFLALSNELELQAAKSYRNQTMINDCVTMIMRLLAKTTSFSQSRLIDASPSQIAMKFSELRREGDPRVGNIYQVAMDEVDRPDKHLMKSLWVNSMESKLFINFFFVNQALRLYFDLRSEKIHDWDPAVRKILDETLTERAEAELKTDLQIEIFQDQVDNLESVGDRPLLRQTIVDYFDRKIDFYERRSKKEAELTELEIRILDQTKIEILKKTQSDLLEAIDHWKK